MRDDCGAAFSLMSETPSNNKKKTTKDWKRLFQDETLDRDSAAELTVSLSHTTRPRAEGVSISAPMELLSGRNLSSIVPQALNLAVLFQLLVVLLEELLWVLGAAVTTLPTASLQNVEEALLHCLKSGNEIEALFIL